MNSRLTDNETRLSYDSPVKVERIVSPDEFRQLLVSHRRTVRNDRREERLRGLQDLDTGELFLVDERRLFEEGRRPKAITPSCSARAAHKELDLAAELTLTLANNGEGRRLLVYLSRFTYCLEGADELAASYFLENWESGITSGAIYGLRKSGRPVDRTRLIIGRLVGRLRSEDMDVLAKLAANCVAVLCGCNCVTPTPEGWEFDIKLEVDEPA